MEITSRCGNIGYTAVTRCEEHRVRKMASNERINYKLIAPDRWRKVQFGVGGGYDCVGYVEKVRDQPARERSTFDAALEAQQGSSTQLTTFM